MKQKIIKLRFFLIIIFYLIINIYSYSYASRIEIIANVGGEIITNIDIEKEYNKLIILNNKYSEIEKNKIQEFVKQTLIKEIIKKKELEKYFKFNNNNEIIKKKIKEIYLNLGYENEQSFISFIQKKGLNLNDIYNKIEIEFLWNQLIFEIYKDSVIINKSNIRKKIIESLKDRKIFNLSELVFTYEKKNEIEKKFDEIKKSINDIGFEKTVLLYSVSTSKENYGNIGWIDELSLSNIVLQELQEMKINEISKPIPIPNAILVIRLNDIKKPDNDNENIDIETNRLIEIERNNQLNNFSLIYYNKIKENISIDEK